MNPHSEVIHVLRVDADSEAAGTAAAVLRREDGRFETRAAGPAVDHADFPTGCVGDPLGNAQSEPGPVAGTRVSDIENVVAGGV